MVIFYQKYQSAPQKPCLAFSGRNKAVYNSIQGYSYLVNLFVVQSLSHVQLWDSIYCSTPGFPVLHYLPEFTQVHVHWVSDAILPSHPLSTYMLSLPELFPFPFLPPEIASVYTAEIMVVSRESLDLRMGLSAALKILLGPLSNGCSCSFDRCSSCQCSRPKTTAGQTHSLPSLDLLWT